MTAITFNQITLAEVDKGMFREALVKFSVW